MSGGGCLASWKIAKREKGSAVTDARRSRYQRGIVARSSPPGGVHRRALYSRPFRPFSRRFTMRRRKCQINVRGREKDKKKAGERRTRTKERAGKKKKKGKNCKIKRTEQPSSIPVVRLTWPPPQRTRISPFCLTYKKKTWRKNGGKR